MGAKPPCRGAGNPFFVLHWPEKGCETRAWIVWLDCLAEPFGKPSLFKLPYRWRIIALQVSQKRERTDDKILFKQLFRKNSGR
nr:MAG: hypothetical protein EDM05_16295 [Leptolyngbya sp. IPPAS B-1204]